MSYNNTGISSCLRSVGLNIRLGNQTEPSGK